jgi:phenylpyruvate tautomerase PptA (4-oxalocrotonate tautomerase family)
VDPDAAMPIITVEIVADPRRPQRPDAAQALADAIGGCLASAPGHCWVRIRSLGRDDYAENGVPRDQAASPVFVTVLQHSATPDPETAAALTRTIAAALDRAPDCVHVEFAAAAAGRVAFGGTLVR